MAAYLGNIGAMAQLSVTGATTLGQTTIRPAQVVLLDSTPTGVQSQPSSTLRLNAYYFSTGASTYTLNTVNVQAIIDAGSHLAYLNVDQELRVLKLTSANGVTGSTGVFDGINRVYSVSNPPATTIFIGTPVTASGVSTVATNVNSIPVFSNTFPSIHILSMRNFQSVSLASDSYDNFLMSSSDGAAAVGLGRFRLTGTGSSAVDFVQKVPAGSTRAYSAQMQRATGTGSASSVADNTLNSLQVTVIPAV